MNAYKKTIESLWRGKCTVTVRENRTNESTGRAVAVERDICTNAPCRITFDTVRTVDNTSAAAKTVQSVTLLISKSVNIPAGSKITVTQNGTTNIYKKSGIPAVYTYHQEIPLELSSGWA